MRRSRNCPSWAERPTMHRKWCNKVHIMSEFPMPHRKVHAHVAGIYLTAARKFAIVSTFYGEWELRWPCAWNYIALHFLTSSLCRILSCCRVCVCETFRCVVVAEILDSRPLAYFAHKGVFPFLLLSVWSSVWVERCTRLLHDSTLRRRFWNVMQPGEHSCRAGCFARILPALNI